MTAASASGRPCQWRPLLAPSQFCLCPRWFSASFLPPRVGAELQPLSILHLTGHTSPPRGPRCRCGAERHTRSHPPLPDAGSGGRWTGSIEFCLRRHPQALPSGVPLPMSLTVGGGRRGGPSSQLTFQPSSEDNDGPRTGRNPRLVNGSARQVPRPRLPQPPCI